MTAPAPTCQPIVPRLRHLAKLLGFDLTATLNEAADIIERQEGALRFYAARDGQTHPNAWAWYTSPNTGLSPSIALLEDKGQIARAALSPKPAGETGR